MQAEALVPPQEAYSCSADHKKSRIITQSVESHCRDYKNPPLIAMLRQTYLRR